VGINRRWERLGADRQSAPIGAAIILIHSLSIGSLFSRDLSICSENKTGQAVTVMVCAKDPSL
jgi:hypothetical protein